MKTAPLPPNSSPRRYSITYRIGDQRVITKLTDPLQQARDRLDRNCELLVNMGCTDIGLVTTTARGQLVRVA